MSTPIFDAVQAEHDVPMLPIPAHPSHEEFLRERGFYDWVAGLEKYDRPSVTRPKAATTSMTGTMRPVPTKRRKR